MIHSLWLASFTYCSHRFFFLSFLSMASTTTFLATALLLFSSALAFSPDQCNLTSYGAPTKAACNTLLTNIANLGAKNTSYLFIPTEFATPAGLSNNTRKNFPQSWSTSKCLAASLKPWSEMKKER